LAHLLFPGDPKHRAGADRTPEEVRADEFARNLLIPLAGVASWGPAYDLAQSVARTERPPVRIADRATQAYQLGKRRWPCQLVNHPTSQMPSATPL
jgi:hypothetical protein